MIKGNMAALEMAYDKAEKEMKKASANVADANASGRRMKQSA